MLSLQPMGRILAIDYGRKRTGLAATDNLQMIANGLTTVPSGELVSWLSAYVAKEPVDLFVVGLPKQMNNEPSENMKYVEAFVTHLKRTIPDIPVEYPFRIFRLNIMMSVSRLFWRTRQCSTEV